MIDVTATLNGLTIGAGTSYRWAAWPDGLVSTPQIRVGDIPRAQSHGVVAGQDWMGSASIVFDLIITGTSRTDAETKLAALLAAFAPEPANVPLDVRLFGAPDEYRMYGRPRGVQVALDRKVLSGIIRARCEFVATDPRRYSTTQQTASTGLSTAVGGLAFPAAAPFVFGSGGTDSTMSCPNVGTFPAPWVATFTGPLVAPALTHLATGKVLNLSGANLAAGETLVVDSLARTVLLNGSASRYSWLTSTSQWFDLDPGANSVNLTGASGAGNVSIAWRSVWI
jgi:hypothetical protein